MTKLKNFQSLELSWLLINRGLNPEVARAADLLSVDGLHDRDPHKVLWVPKTLMVIEIQNLRFDSDADWLLKQLSFLEQCIKSNHAIVMCFLALFFEDFNLDLHSND